MKLVNKNISKTFYKFILSYFTAFVIPLAVSFLFFNYYYMKTYSEEVYKNHHNQTETTQKSVDIQLKQLNNMIEQMMYDNEFKRWFSSDEVNRISIYRKIKGYTLMNDFISDIIYIEPEINLCISSQNAFDLDTFNRYYKYSQQAYKQDEQYIDSILNINKETWLPFANITYVDGMNKETLTYVVPLSMSQGGTGMVVFLIDKEKFSLVFPANLNSTILILDHENTLIYASLDKVEPYLKLLKANIKEQGKKKTYGQKIEDQYITFSNSDINKWTYINILPENDVIGKIIDIQQKYLIISVVMFLFGCCIVYVFSYINYNPIFKLLNTIKESFEHPITEKNEIETAMMALNSLRQSSDKMKEMIKRSMLQNLLKGSYKKLEEFNSQAKTYNVKFNYSSFFIAVISVLEEIEAQQTYINIPYIESNLNMICEGYGFENLESNHSVFICSIDQYNQKIINQLFNKIVIELKNNHHINIKIGISGPCEDIVNLNRLYIEAVHEVEKIGDRSIKKIAFYGENKNINISAYPTEEISEIKQSLIELDINRFKYIMEILIENLNSSQISMFMRVCAFYDITNTIIKTLTELDANALTELNKYNVILSETNISINKMSLILDSLSKDAINYMLNISDYDEHSLTDQIDIYINKNIMEPDFSINNMAKHFNLSNSNLSHIYKKKYGRVLSDHIAELRINYTKELLKNNSAMSDIVNQLGYSNTSSFIRWFKKQTGITPGEFRKIYLNKRKAED